MTGKRNSATAMKWVAIFRTELFVLERKVYFYRIGKWIVPANSNFNNQVISTKSYSYINPETKSIYISIANELMEQGAECIILGCTEIPLLISQNDFSTLVLDTAKIHSEAIVKYAINDL